MNTKIKCLLLDDELPGLTYLKMLCEQLPQLEVIKAFNDPGLLLKEWQSLDFDLLISDIQMPGFNGLDVADAVRGKAIIFTTAYKDFATDAFDRDAVDYVVKPVKPERLLQAVQKVAARLEKAGQKPKQLQLNTDKGKALIDIDSIFYITASDIDSRDKVIFLDSGSKITVKNCSFEKLLELLPQQGFSRINKRTVIALKHVRFYSHSEITASLQSPDGYYTFPLSEIYRGVFLKKIKAG